MFLLQAVENQYFFTKEYRVKKSFIVVGFFGLNALSATAETWVDQQHSNIKNTLYSWSNNIDEWIGENDPNRPASASLRVMLDQEWNRYDGYSIKPRVRAKIKLPALKQYLKNLSLVLGDEDIDNQSRDKHQLHRNYKTPLREDRNYDGKQTRDDNASLALRWSNGIKSLGIKTDFDVGVRSGADIFGRLRASKTWQFTDQFSTRLEQIYRYGSNSKHYLRTNLEHKFAENERRSLNNHTYLQYTHDIDEDLNWGNSFYRQHNYSNFKQLNYGFNFGGEVDSKKFDINYYGPFINWRQPVLRKWLYIQPELNFYNNKKLDRKHTLGAFLRLEAVF